MFLWMDMTYSLITWNKGMIGIVRTELLLAKYLYEIDKNIHFSVCTEKGFREIPHQELSWLFTSSDVGKSYEEYQKNRYDINNLTSKEKNTLHYFINKFIDKLELHRHIHRWKRSINKRLVRFHIIKPSDNSSENFMHPYASGDTIFSCGWFGSQKEEFFSRIKAQVPQIKIGYLVYDLVMVRNDIRHLYYPADLPFECYLKWISYNCNFILYGGQIAQKDAEDFFKIRKWNIPLGDWINFGSEIKVLGNSIPCDAVLSKYKIHKPYIISVGSISARKNYKILYQAYCMLRLENYEHIPDLVIIGEAFSDKDLISQFRENPLTRDKVHIFSPSDEELEILYRNCIFAALPSLYEGRSVALQEALTYGKLCLCSDVAPLHEAAGNYAIYLNPRHPREWANAIKHYSENPNEVISWEKRIHAEWTPHTWKDCAHDIYYKISDLSNKYDDIENNNKNTENIPNIYYDMTLFFYNGNLSGIPRAQLLLGRYISKLNKNIKFFTLHSEKYMEIPSIYINNTLTEGPIDTAVKDDKASLPSYALTPKMNFPFKKGDIVFSAGVGYGNIVYDNLIKSHNDNNFTFIQLIYDFTPILIPHTHSMETLKNYPAFLSKTYNLADYIVYGGATAQHDGEEYQKSVLKQKSTPSFVLKFGSDIQSHSTTRQEEDDTLKKLGITREFLLSVGTIEARKNHELLYEAYLELMSTADDPDSLPQLVICGRPGWKTDDFRQRLQVDRRIFGRILMFSPSDEELDILYKRCKFTLLASQYEGWSLTLPESLNYGKFCLTADVSPLREIGQDIVDYANPYDPEEWANKIRYYLLTPKALAAREARIAACWINTTWEDSAEYLNKMLMNILNTKERKAS